MADARTDLLMRIVNKGAALVSECSTQFVPPTGGDTLITDFDPGYFCELHHLHVSAGLPARPVTISGGGRGDAAAVIDIRPVDFVRNFDTASTLLFKAMVGCETLDSISIVKRRGSGTGNSGEVFLRMDFEKVLITRLFWHDGPKTVQEIGTFIYRNLNVRYRLQSEAGAHGKVIQTSWKMKG